MDLESDKTNFDDFPYERITEGAEKMTAENVVRRFKMLILSGDLPGGAQLPTESTLCEKLGISRSMLREAFSVLSEYGLITRTKHGTFINASRDFSPSLVLDYRFEDSSILEILEFRKIFEVESAYLAAQNATTDDIKALKESIMAIKDCKDDPEALTLNDLAFHLGIANSTHNRLLISITQLVADTYYKGILAQFEIVQSMSGMTTQEATIYFHNKIFDAILLKDPNAAESIMREHMDSILAAVRKETKETTE